jgi:hypothetical protein
MSHLIGIVVAEYEKQRFIQAGNNKIKVIQGKISGAKDQIYIGKTVFYGR